jgi:hypothetical protein
MTYPISVKIEYPDRLSRLTTFFRIFMIIPHTIILYFLGIALGVILVISWFAVLFAGRYPRSLFNFVTYVFRWNARVNGYSYFLTDKYPPFTGNE